ncbi:HNH endonuclease [Sphingomonas turrisvirgatae]|uniref:HNH domain-containing protein n=1 Tax=Sphingomonas turrisvirgatae TaxID=1888892 RepID=A0A1E3LS24_9SPHN|nr:HNH endonuclease [Sphingomonas turrisvirgatae]ODP36562.1 hypothetical protein BFL28_19840 [Sphingomonas turrisvirgatae]
MMRFKSIASHLRPYRMLASRLTTINHMFAAAIAPHDPYDEAHVREAVSLLGNDPDDDLSCAYCGAPAETWDHVFATVKNSRFSGHGHRLGNLLPCCKSCNSRKGNKAWQAHLSSLPMDDVERSRRSACIERYLDTYGQIDLLAEPTPDHVRLDELRAQVLSLVAEADEVASRIRAGAQT